MTKTLRIVFTLAIASAVFAILAFLPYQRCLRALLEWAAGLGTRGAVCLVLAYIPASLLFLPAVFLTLGCGFLYGPVYGGAMATLGITLGAVPPFLIARVLGRDWVVRWISHHSHFAAIDQAAGRQGFKAVLLVRLCPFFPYSPVNYLFGLTRIPLGRYVLATVLGRFPGLTTCAYVGSAAKSIAEVAAGNVPLGTKQQVLLGLGLAAAVVMLVVFTQFANRVLLRSLGTPTRPHTGSDHPCL